MKKILSLLALTALTIGLLGSCKKEDPKVSVTGVTLDKTTLEITVGDPDVKLTATVAPENATDKTVNWASDKAEVATVDNQGSVHAVAPGEAIITVTTTDGGKTATCVVKVKAAVVPVSSVALDKTELTLTVGDPDVKLTATVAPDNATDKTVNWASDKAEVATVDNQGSVHAVAPGEAIITVTTTDGGKTATCTVTVKAALPEGALAGKFSVSATKKVHFSKGNLVATINASGTPTAWKFAANQYDCLGEGGANKTIGIAEGDIDLFGWSTTSTTYGISTSTSLGDYSRGFVDWGISYCAKNSITPDNTWRTLNWAEWCYLFNKDNTYGVNNRSGKYQYGVTVCGKENCVVLLPDNWEWDETADEHNVGTGWQTGGYPETQTGNEVTWKKMEDAGAVCLPAAGYRYGSNVYRVGGYGYYWSSTGGGFFNASSVHFNSLDVYPDDDDRCYYGYSVRLITESK